MDEFNENLTIRMGEVWNILLYNKDQGHITEKQVPLLLQQFYKEAEDEASEMKK